MSDYTATYSPEDNKLRLYATERLDAETYAKAKACGLRWAPQQKLFFAFWSPRANDLLLELAGDIEDEDKSLVERQEERAERFEEYSDKRAQDADRAHNGVAAISDNIPLGQPILVGHHSERRARKDAERIENGMRKAVKMWETSKYWTQRAEGALAHAKYKELPEVRARRIKTLEAEKRKLLRDDKRESDMIALWNAPEELTQRRAENIAGSSHVSKCFTLAEYPRDHHVYEGSQSLWNALTDGIITPEHAKEICLRVHARTIAGNKRWIDHYNLRLEYEIAMLAEQGATKLLEKPKRPKLLPICNYKQDSFTLPSRWHKGQFDTLPQMELTTEQYQHINVDSRGTREVDNSHRIRIAIVDFNEDGTIRRFASYKAKHHAIFLTDSKTHAKPAPVEKAAPAPRVATFTPREPEPIDERAEKFDALKDQSKAGVQVVVAPQLFPTPAALAKRLCEAADVQPGHRVLEPSAGTGSITHAIFNAGMGADCVRVVAVEINPQLVRSLEEQRNKRLYANDHNFDIRCADFLQCNGDLGKFDRVVMNPPFEKQQDIEHVTHALHFLKEGGKLAAVMSAGILFRQDRKATEFRALIEEKGGTIEELPADSFKQSGTSVNTVLVEVAA